MRRSLEEMEERRLRHRRKEFDDIIRETPSFKEIFEGIQEVKELNQKILERLSGQENLSVVPEKKPSLYEKVKNFLKGGNKDDSK